MSGKKPGNQRNRVTSAGKPAESGVAIMNRMKSNCTGTESKLPESMFVDMLLDPEAVPAKVQAHVAACDGCQSELAELRATMNLLDTWQAPAPNPYFLTRLEARMREERQAAPAGRLASWFARLRAHVAYGPGLHVRPLAAMALTVVLLLGGGTYLDMTDWTHPAQPTGDAAMVHDLQILDNNAQVLDQMEALSANQNGD